MREDKIITRAHALLFQLHNHAQLKCNLFTLAQHFSLINDVDRDNTKQLIKSDTLLKT